MKRRFGVCDCWGYNEGEVVPVPRPGGGGKRQARTGEISLEWQTFQQNLSSCRQGASNE